MTADAESRHAVMERIEAGRLELPQTIRNDTAAGRERALEPAAQLHVSAVQQQMMAAEIDRVRIELVEAQPRGRVIRSDHGTGAFTLSSASTHPPRSACVSRPSAGSRTRPPMVASSVLNWPQASAG